ncbi:hypothetical protein AAFF_G00405300 [Aldrovandia affinis]|uniref:Fibronectin type-III domain-containing protein n=1 Tax=Aldrovandia affinis TaxID=143900 RepID=A0AAD7SBY0_9TELE|nr:hypothetical protein AAFF_G00405300 [Aldrovandia affinis]
MLRGSLNMRILLTFLLGFNSLLRGAEAQEYKLACLNDYMVTISCVLNISTDSFYVGNDSNWLEFEQDEERFQCRLVKVMDHYCCTSKSTDPFIETDCFVITLCSESNGNKKCLEMDNQYEPRLQIKPISPGNLKVNWSSGHYQFTWDSGYESYLHFTFMKELKYNLQYYKRGHPDSALTIHSHNKIQHIDGVNFESDTEYIAKVRSSPDQLYYKGQWSQWSTAVTWRTNVSQDAAPSVKADVFLFIGSFFFLACLLAGVLVFLCFRPAVRCRIKPHSSVPTPVPYFQSLYSNYNGDFQSWLVSRGNMGEQLKMQETLKIETLIKTTPIDTEDRFLPPPIYQTQFQHTYINPCGNACSVAEQSSFKMFSSFSVDQMGTSEDDSGCQDLIYSPTSSWPHRAMTSFEPESMCYSEDYCTLSDTHNDLMFTTGVELGSGRGSFHSEVIPEGNGPC